MLLNMLISVVNSRSQTIKNKGEQMIAYKPYTNKHYLVDEISKIKKIEKKKLMKKTNKCLVELLSKLTKESK